MRKELDEKLCKDYPELYKDRHASMRTTCMCWGFDVGDGWFPLINLLSLFLSAKVVDLKHRISHCKEMMSSKEPLEGWYKEHYVQDTVDKLESELAAEIPKVPSASQVKEKFGTLRFYTNGATEVQNAYIDFAEAMSGHICEGCGSTKDVFKTKGWIKTTCKACDPDEYAESLEPDAD